MKTFASQFQFRVVAENLMDQNGILLVSMDIFWQQWLLRVDQPAPWNQYGDRGFFVRAGKAKINLLTGLNQAHFQRIAEKLSSSEGRRLWMLYVQHLSDDPVFRRGVKEDFELHDLGPTDFSMHDVVAELLKKWGHPDYKKIEGVPVTWSGVDSVNDTLGLVNK